MWEGGRSTGCEVSGLPECGGLPRVFATVVCPKSKLLLAAVDHYYFLYLLVRVSSAHAILFGSPRIAQMYLLPLWTPSVGRVGLLMTNVLICAAMVRRIKRVESTLPVEYLQRVGYLQVCDPGV